MGEKALLASTAANLAQALYAQGRRDEAAELGRVSEESAAEDDLLAQAAWRALRGKLLAAHGHWQEGAALATEAVRLAERTDFLTIHAETLLDLGAVLRQGGRSEAADAATGDALELYLQKGDVVSAGRVRSLLGMQLRQGEDDQRPEVQHGQIQRGKAH